MFFFFEYNVIFSPFVFSFSGYRFTFVTLIQLSQPVAWVAYFNIFNNQQLVLFILPLVCSRISRFVFQGCVRGILCFDFVHLGFQNVAIVYQQVVGTCDANLKLTLQPRLDSILLVSVLGEIRKKIVYRILDHLVEFSEIGLGKSVSFRFPSCRLAIEFEIFSL